MPFAAPLLIALAIAVLAILALQLAILLRPRGDAGWQARLDALRDDGERLERLLREEQRAGRDELAAALGRFGERQQAHQSALADADDKRMAELRATLDHRLAQLTERTDTGLQALAQRLAEDARKNREETTLALGRFGEQLQQRLAALTADNEKRMGEVRATLEAKLGAIQQDNAAKLEQMRATVDEKLHATLETRLGESFKLVSERLEQVQRGLGEMQSLATGVGDLKRVLTNVKTRGILGEVQLGALLEQLLTPDQYAANVATVPGADARVEFAIRMPGPDPAAPVWLPIDAKFPLEDYQRLQDAQENADTAAAAQASAALERRVREEARRIREKYVAPPHTVDFAILFLPTEGLFAEVLRRPGLFDALQRELHVTVAGPTTLSAILTSLKAGFRTLAIEQRSSEVWQLLGAVKTEFGKFGAVLDKVKKNLDQASNQIDATGVRTRAIERRLRGVESLGDDEAAGLLGHLPAAGNDDPDADA